MSSTISTVQVVLVLGILGLSMGIPLDTPYNPQSFYQSGRILGGEDAPEGSTPYMIALVVGGFVKSLSCGGSLVSPHTVLTAAHCIDPLVSWITGQLLPSLTGQIGSNSLTEGYEVLKFSGHENHPEWDMMLIKNDIGVLRLEKPVDKKHTPINLNMEWIGGGQRATVTGWGMTYLWSEVPDRLQLLETHTLSPEECEAGVLEANEILGYSPPVFPSVEICTVHKHGFGHGNCYGDSGSALRDVYGRQIGIVSWGYACAVGLPDVYTRVSGFKDWLNSALMDELIE